MVGQDVILHDNPGAVSAAGDPDRVVGRHGVEDHRPGRLPVKDHAG